MDIYSILASKPHNTHYLNRYIRFIKQCQHKNVNHNGYAEKHHICPKAKDMFPEYASFKKNKWNLSLLTPRQHFIAHILLWKSYPNIASMTYAAHSMRNYQDTKVNSRLYENLKIEFIKTQSTRTHKQHLNMSIEEKNKISDKISTNSKNLVQAKTKEGLTVRIAKTEFDNSVNYVGHTKGMTTVKDADGRFHFVSVDDHRIKSGELVGPNTGKTFSEEVRKKLRKVRKGRKHTEKAKMKMRKPKGQQKKLICPYCGKCGGASNIKRYHYENCKNAIVEQLS
jgi:rubrerythrin